jgi:hypothetical protein
VVATRILNVKLNFEIMKKLFVILLASMALAACGDGSNRSEANRDDVDTYDNTTPSVAPETDLQRDTTGSDYMRSDTTAIGTDPGTGAGTTTVPTR